MNNKILRARGLKCISEWNVLSKINHCFKLFLYIKTDHLFFCAFISVHGVRPLQYKAPS